MSLKDSLRALKGVLMPRGEEGCGGPEPGLGAPRGQWKLGAEGPQGLEARARGPMGPGEGGREKERERGREEERQRSTLKHRLGAVWAGGAPPGFQESFGR